MSELIDTTEMYLKTVYELEEDGVPPLRARIVERLDHSGPTVSQTVARMERDGLISREAHPSDARSKQIFLTAKARGLEDEVTRIARDINANALAVLDEHERGQFLEMLKRIIEQQRALLGDNDAED